MNYFVALLCLFLSSSLCPSLSPIPPLPPSRLPPSLTRMPSDRLSCFHVFHYVTPSHSVLFVNLSLRELHRRSPGWTIELSADTYGQVFSNVSFVFVFYSALYSLCIVTWLAPTYTTSTTLLARTYRQVFSNASFVFVLYSKLISKLAFENFYQVFQRLKHAHYFLTLSFSFAYWSMTKTPSLCTHENVVFARQHATQFAIQKEHKADICEYLPVGVSCRDNSLLPLLAEAGLLAAP